MNYSLAYLTYAPLSPVDAIHLAAKLGYSAVGLRALPASVGGDTSALLQDKSLLRETLLVLKATGITVFDVEIVRINEHFSLEAFKPFLELCGKLSAKAILVAGDDTNENRFIENYSAFCEAAKPYGLTADLEFMPWTAIKNANQALRIVEKSGQSNAGILVDSLHAARSATSMADLAALPRKYLNYIQMCDAPAEIPTTNEGLIYTAREARLLPGEGGIDLKGMFAVLPKNVPISLELPNFKEKAEVGVETWARKALASAAKILDI